MQIKEILDPAVAVAQDHHRLKFLRDDRLARVGKHLGDGKVE